MKTDIDIVQAYIDCDTGGRITAIANSKAKESWDKIKKELLVQFTNCPQCMNWNGMPTFVCGTCKRRYRDLFEKKESE